MNGREKLTASNTPNAPALSRHRLAAPRMRAAAPGCGKGVENLGDLQPVIYNTLILLIIFFDAFAAVLPTSATGSGAVTGRLLHTIRTLHAHRGGGWL